MAALGSDASWLAAAGTPAPLSVRPPDESFCSLLSQHPMFRDDVCDLGMELRLLQR